MNSISLKIFDNQEELVKRVRQWQADQKKVVFTNGCFDILHKGHVLYLEEAKAEGDYLIVGVNTDQSVQRLKGIHRPINDESCRSFVLAALSSVDAVILFDEETPLLLIENIKPDILVKGGDYPIDQIVGSDYVLKNGGLVKALSLIQGYSTTLIEQKIKNHC